MFNYFQLTYSFNFTYIISFLVPCAYVSVESIDCILLWSFVLKAILLIASVKRLRLSLLNLCCVFSIFLFFTNSLRLSTLNFFFSKYFNFLSILAAFKQFLSSWNLSFLFMTHVFVPFAFLFSSMFFLISYMFLLLIQQTFSRFVLLIHLSFVQLLFFSFSFRQQSVYLKCQIFFKIFCNAFVNIICFHMNNEAVCIHLTELYIFTIFWF